MAEKAPAPPRAGGLDRLREHLPQDEFRKVADARRAIWTSGLGGMVGGAVLGMVAFPIMRRFKPRWQWGKEGTMAVLATAAGMGFVMARLRAEGARSVIDEIRVRMIEDERKAVENIQDTFHSAVDKARADIPDDAGVSAVHDDVLGLDDEPAPSDGDGSRPSRGSRRRWRRADRADPDAPGERT